MLDNQIDLNILLKKYRAIDQELSEKKEKLYKIVFILKCYQDLYVKNKDNISQLYQILAQKNSIIEKLQADLYRLSADKKVVKKITTIDTIVRAAECQEDSSCKIFSN